MYASNILGNAVKLKNLYDINLGFDYYYNSLFVIFADINNIIGNKSQEYYLYPMQRTNFLIGLTYSFGGYKE